MNSGMTVPQVAQGFVDSLEHRQDEVSSMYEEFFHRSPDAMAANWVIAMLDGASEEDVAEVLLDSPEYLAAHPDQTQFIQGLYQDVLGRQADASGYATWEQALASGESRQAVVQGFLGSAESIDQVIENYYTNDLHRQPDLATASQWATVLQSPGGSASEVQIGLLSSPEFVQDAQQA